MHGKDEPTPLTVDHGEPLDPAVFTSISATTAKNEFGQMLDMVNAGRTVVITKHDAPKAVVMSFDEFKAITERESRKLNTLSDEFDALLEGMQGAKARAGLKAAFDATPERLGRAAVKAARKRRRG